MESGDDSKTVPTSSSGVGKAPQEPGGEGGRGGRVGFCSDFTKLARNDCQSEEIGGGDESSDESSGEGGSESESAESEEENNGKEAEKVEEEEERMEAGPLLHGEGQDERRWKGLVEGGRSSARRTRSSRFCVGRSIERQRGRGEFRGGKGRERGVASKGASEERKEFVGGRLMW